MADRGRRSKKRLVVLLVTIQVVLTALALWSTFGAIDLVRETGEPVRALPAVWAWVIWLGGVWAGRRAWRRA